MLSFFFKKMCIQSVICKTLAILFRLWYVEPIWCIEKIWEVLLHHCWAMCYYSHDWWLENTNPWHMTVMLHEHGILNHWQLNCLFKSLFRLTSKNTSKIHIIGSMWAEYTGDCWIPLTKGLNSLWPGDAVELGQPWFGYWLVAWQHQAIT